jgi:hypothetical protein
LIFGEIIDLSFSLKERPKDENKEVETIIEKEVREVNEEMEDQEDKDENEQKEPSKE